MSTRLFPVRAEATAGVGAGLTGLSFSQETDAKDNTKPAATAIFFVIVFIGKVFIGILFVLGKMKLILVNGGDCPPRMGLVF